MSQDGLILGQDDASIMAPTTLPNSLKLTFCNGAVLHRNPVQSTFGDWLLGITELSKLLQAIDIDVSARTLHPEILSQEFRGMSSEQISLPWILMDGKGRLCYSTEVLKYSTNVCL